MTHRSKLCAALVDVPAAVYDREVAFWSGAVGRPGQPGQVHPEYTEYGELFPGLHLMAQRVDAPARVHLDIETDDVEAEVRRLERLGAERVEQHHHWWVMRDPAGLLFCVVPVQTGESFPALATRWEDG